MDTQKILIIDDNDYKREQLAKYVMQLGHEALEADNGLLGLAEAQFKQPDLILLDLSMPKMNGMEFLCERRRDIALSQIPVIIISCGDCPDVHDADCIKMGAEDILPMPLEYEVLKARIENCLTRRFQQKRERELQLQMQRLLVEVQEANRKTERLLQSIFPKDALRELKHTNTISPRRLNDVAVLFCDIVGFTAFCESHSPDDVVEVLQKLVEAQEQVAERHGVEKVKTIGDCFMAVAGLQAPGDAALIDCIRCGIELAALPSQLAMGMQVRVGIHAGPAVAGKIGHKKYTYDLWGDTVNTACRVESEATPQTVFVTSAVWTRVGHRCQGDSQGMIHLKGKGEVELYRVDKVFAAEPAVTK
jgi:class 3 adenylate cyclase